jgi:hypothetical protein
MSPTLGFSETGLAWNLQSCLSLLSAAITGMCEHLALVLLSTSQTLHPIQH